MISSDRIDAALYATLAAIAATGLVFTAAPGLDLAVSAVFHTPAHGFADTLSPTLARYRGFIWLLAQLSALAGLLLFVWGHFRPASAPLPRRAGAFVLLSFALGPGLISNLVFKSHWGRARPRDITLFGGDLDFTPALLPSDQCLRNCSFVSGEGSGAATLCLTWTLLILHRPPFPGRTSILVVLWLACLFGAYLRISFGGHFLSDVLFAILFCALITLALFRALVLNASDKDRGPAT